MGDKIIGIIKLILCIFIIVYAEIYFFEFLAWLKIDVNSLSVLVKQIFVLILYILIMLSIYYLYRDDLQNDFKRFKRNVFPNILMSFVFFVILTIVIWVVSYLCEVIANSFNVNFIGLSHLNVFDKKLDLRLIILIFKSIIIIPFIKCAVYILGINEIFYSKKTGIFFSALVGAVVAGLSMSGSVIFIFFNVIPYFTLYFGLAYIYRKNNSNIWFSITSIILYTLLASVLLAKIA